MMRIVACVWVGIFAFLPCLSFLRLVAAAEPTAVEPAADAKTFVAVIQPLLKKHCAHCHGEKKQEAGLRVDRLGADFFQEKSGSTWQEIADRVNLGEMPPKGEPSLARDELT